MRKLIIAAATAALLSVAGPAFAGPQGTSDSEDANNNVSCGGTATVANPASSIQVDTAGDQNGGAVVVCNDDTPDGPSPITGRVIATGSTSGGYVAADGENSNPAQAQGWARVNVGTSPSVKCGGPADPGTGTNAESNNGTQAACG